MKRIAVALLLFMVSSGFPAESGFTQEDRERLIRLEATLKTFMEQVDRRFEQMDRRISDLREDMNKRFEQVDNRFEELRADMNNRFQRVDKELDRIVTIMATIFAGQIGLVGAVIAFAWWDRKTIINYELCA